MNDRERPHECPLRPFAQQLDTDGRLLQTGLRFGRWGARIAQFVPQGIREAGRSLTGAFSAERGPNSYPRTRSSADRRL
jgi:hypothetical protein